VRSVLPDQGALGKAEIRKRGFAVVKLTGSKTLQIWFHEALAFLRFHSIRSVNPCDEGQYPSTTVSLAMKTMSGNNRYLLLSILFLSGLGFAMVSQLTPFGSAITPDSIYYLDAAQHIRAGDGIVQSNFALNRKSPVSPFSTWPPLYPLLLSLNPAVEKTPLDAAVPINALCLSLTGTVMILILRSFVSPLMAWIAALVYIVSGPAIINATYTWSECLFITLLTGAIYFSYHASIAERQNLRFHLDLFFLAVSLAAVFYCRYIGLVFGSVIFFSWCLSANRKEAIRAYLITLIGFCLLATPLLLRNYMLGDLTGGDFTKQPRTPSTVPLHENLLQTWYSLRLAVPDSITWLGLIGIVSLIVSAIVFLKFCPGTHQKSEKPSPKHQRVLAALLSLTMIVYLGALVVLRTIVEFEEIHVRYVSVIIPFIIILCSLCMKNTPRKARQIPQLFVALFLLCGFFLQGLFLYRSAINNWHQYGTPLFPTNSRAQIAYSHLAPPFRVGLFHEVVATAPLAENEIYVMGFPNLFSVVTGAESREIEFPISENSLAALRSPSNYKGYLVLFSPKNQRDFITYAYKGRHTPEGSRYFDRGSFWIIPIPIRAP
jgi:hypothetical protein